MPNTGADSTAVCRAGAGATVPVGTAVVGCSLTTLGLPPKSNTAPFVVGYVSQLDNAEWIRPGRGGAANGGRGNHLMGGINNWNIAITKQTPVWGESRYLEFSAEFVNAFNHPSYTIGVGSVFGFNTAAQNNTGYIIPGPASNGFLQDNTFSGGLGQAPYQRVIQFSLRFVFLASQEYRFSRAGQQGPARFFGVPSMFDSLGHDGQWQIARRDGPAPNTKALSDNRP